MVNLNTAKRPDLEVAILENDLEDTLFNGIDEIMKMDTEKIREILINWLIENCEN